MSDRREQGESNKFLTLVKAPILSNGNSDDKETGIEVNNHECSDDDAAYPDKELPPIDSGIAQELASQEKGNQKRGFLVSLDAHSPRSFVKIGNGTKQTSSTMADGSQAEASPIPRLHSRLERGPLSLGVILEALSDRWRLSPAACLHVRE